MEQVGDLGLVGRQRVEAMVQTLASLGSRGESLAEVAHDARNMVTALGLYCDLLEEPGVLAVPFAHYGHELRLVAAASRRLVEKLVALDAQAGDEMEVRGVSIWGAAGQGAQGRSAAAGASSSSDPVADLRSATTVNAGAGSQGGNRDARAARESSRSPGREYDADLEPDLESGLGPGLETDLEPGLPRDLARNCGRAAPANPEWNGAGQNGEPSLERAAAAETASGGANLFPGRRGRQWETLLSQPVDNLAAELLANRSLLSALAGPGFAVTVDAEGGARPVRLTAEDLTRLLVNLVKNAAEAIPAAAGPGHIQISLREYAQANGAPASILLAIEDNGPGIPQEALGRVFDSGFTTHARNAAGGGWPVLHRGLGLAIARSLVEAAGGRITASNREQGGARIALELPVRAA